MQDADLFTELSQVVIKGVFSRSAANLEKLYKIYDYDFEDRQRIEDKITNTINFIKDNFEQVNSSGIMTNYLFYSLFSALIYNKFGIENIQPDVVDDLEPINDYCIDINLAIQNIMELFRAIDEKDDTGRYREFVKASSSTTHSLNNRIIRLKWFVLALQNKL